MEHNGRPAKVITAPETGADGEEYVGVRYLDVPQWQDVPGFPGMSRPADGSSAIVRVGELSLGPKEA